MEEMQRLCAPLRGEVQKLRAEMVETLCALVSRPAVSPGDGGTGEMEKTAWLEKKIVELGFGPCERYDLPDAANPSVMRPNLVARIPGREPGRLWFVTHLDVVPEGDRGFWSGDPFVPRVTEERIYGRGSNDNGQEVVASLYAAVALKQLGLTPRREICLCFVADEEMGSVHGIRHLLDRNLFSPEDLLVVPDGGNERGDFIEIAEKSILWMQFTVQGVQVHASMPQLGRNACRAANAFSVALDEALHAAFPEEDILFDPPVSTFEPTKRSANVPNVNTVPGREVFCFDCRVLPSVPLESVLSVVDEVLRRIEERYGVSVRTEFLQKEQAAMPTSREAPVVRRLEDALRVVLNVEPRVGGIGGGTCAAYFRARGIPAVVWAREADNAHQPDEYAEISHLLDEALVFALLMAEA